MVIVQLNPVTINKHAGNISKYLNVLIYNPEQYKRRLNIYASQILLPKTFLENYGDENSLVCRTVRGSIGDHPVLFLPSYVTREHVHVEYKLRWKTMMDYQKQQGEF